MGIKNLFKFTYDAARNIAKEVFSLEDKYVDNKMANRLFNNTTAYFPAPILQTDLTKLGYCTSFNAKMKEAGQLLKDLYKEVLHDDPYWHLFYEGNFSTLRFSAAKKDAVIEFLDENAVMYTEITSWIDGQEATRKYQGIFTYLFHGFSLLAMTYEDKDFEAVVDRVIHCFMNHQFYRKPLLDEEKEMGMLVEASIIMRNAIRRAFHDGRRYGHIEYSNYMYKKE